MNSMYSLFKVKQGKRAEWAAWCAYLMEHYDEAAATLVEEDLVHEMCQFFEKDGETYVVYRHEPRAGKVKKPANMEKEINKKHFEHFYACLEKIPFSAEGYDIRA
jgi:hypothetical protein